MNLPPGFTLAHAILLRLADAVRESVRLAGNDGVVAGVLFAAMHSHGCTLEQFEVIMSTLVDTGKLERRGHFYFSPDVLPSCRDEAESEKALAIEGRAWE